MTALAAWLGDESVELSPDTAFMTLFARKLSVPPLRVRFGLPVLLFRRPLPIVLVPTMLTSELSSCNVPAWPMLTAIVGNVPKMLRLSWPAVKAPLTAMPLTVVIPVALTAVLESVRVPPSTTVVLPGVVTPPISDWSEQNDGIGSDLGQVAAADIAGKG